MKIAIVSSSYLPQPGRLERHVDELTRGLARRGAAVELLTQGALDGAEPSSEIDGVLIRRFPTLMGRGPFAVAPRLWERLRVAASEFDLVDVHTARPTLALAAARAGPRRLIFTPHAPLHRFLGLPHSFATRFVLENADRVVCTSDGEQDLLHRRFPRIAARTRFVPHGVDSLAIGTAKPFPRCGDVVLSVGGLKRSKRVDRAIAAMADLDPSVRLVVIGEGPAGVRLRAHAADLQVSHRVEFVGGVPDRELHRWLRTARVVVALSEQQNSGLQVIEALAAGAAVVASDIPVHRLAAERFEGSRVTFVAPEGSPLEVADAIAEMSEPRAGQSLPVLDSVPCSWESVVDQTYELYERLLSGAIVRGRTPSDGDDTSPEAFRMQVGAAAPAARSPAARG